MTKLRERTVCLAVAACLLLGGMSACAEPVAGSTAAPMLLSDVPDFAPLEGVTMTRAVTYTGTRLFVDFSYLQSINADIVAWLRQEGTELDVPVVKGADNAYYLKRTALGKKDQYGAVFLDAANASDFTDAMSTLYSFSNSDGGLFRSLKEYDDQEYYDEHPRLLLMTPYADHQIDLFAIVKTTVGDGDSWRIGQALSQTGFERRIAELCAASCISCDPDARPAYGDRVLALATYAKQSKTERIVALGRMRPIRYEATAYVDVNKQRMDSRPTQNGMVEVGTLGQMMYYAQNDEVWSDLRYEAQGSRKFRWFGEGGCGPTAAAIAIANLLDKSELPRLAQYASYPLGYTLCTCSVNQYFCNRLHPQYQLKTPDEFLRYLPLAIASFVTGNNTWGVTSRTKAQGTNMEFLDELCLAYGITLSTTRDLNEALERVREDGCVAIVNISQGGPFTKYGHFAVLAGADDEYLYVLDPLKRDSYEGNKHVEIAQILTPGVVRVPLDRAKECCFYREYILEKPR